jgi:cytochrome P450
MSAAVPAHPFDLTSPEFIADPYPAYRHMREQAPVCRDDKTGFLLVTRYADVYPLLRDRRLSSDQVGAFMARLPEEQQAALAPLRDILTNRVTFTDNPVHHRIRGLMQLAFTPRHVEKMRPVIEAEVNGLIDRVQSAGRMDLVADLADPLPSHVICEMLGLPPGDRARFKGWTDDIYAFLGLSPVPLADRAATAVRSAMQIKAYLAGLFAEIRRNPQDDLLSALVAAEQQGDRLSDTELYSNVVSLINASHETTTNLIANTILTLLRNPDQWQRLRDDPRLIDGVVEEGLRYESPIQMLARIAVEDVPVGGATVARGERVALVIGSANRDPALCPDPDRFDATRGETKHVAFGGGPHFCLGAALGRLEGQVAIAAVARRLPGLRLTGAELRWRPYPVFRGLVSLPVEF